MDYGTPERGVRWLATATLLVAFLALYAALIDSTISPAALYNSDTFWVHALIQDMREGASLRAWKLPPNPYYFPDLALYLLISFVVAPYASVLWRIILFALAQTAVFAAGWLWLYRIVLRGPRARDAGSEAIRARPRADTFVHVQMLLTLAVVFGFVAAGRHMVLSHALSGVFHFGVMTVMPWAAGLTLTALAAPRVPRSNYLLLCAISLLTAFSDTLYLVQVALPALAALAIAGAFMCPRRAGGRWPRVGALAAALALSSLAGYALNYVVLDLRADAHVQPEQWRQSFAALVAWAQEGARRDPWLAALWTASLAALIAATARALAITRKHEDRAAAGRTLFVGVFALLATGTTLGAVVITGTFVGDATARYILPAAFVPLLAGWPLASAHASLRAQGTSPTHGDLSALAPRKPLGVHLAGAFCAGVMIWLLAGNPFPALITAPTFDDPKVRCLDEQTSRRGLRTGLATYWQALYTTALSRTGLRVLQVRADLAIYHWNNNLDWYDTEVDFVVGDTQLPPWDVIDVEQVALRFGSPAESFTCGSATVLVYNRPADLQFRRYVRSQSAIARLPADGTPFTFPGYAMPTWIGGLPIGASKAASEAWGNVEGFLAAAPLVALPRGEYAFELHTFSDSTDSGDWEIVEYDRNPGEAAVAPPLAMGRIVASGRQVATGTFTNPAEANIAVRVRYHGNGTLFVDKLRIRRLEDGDAPPYFTSDSPPAAPPSPPEGPSLRLIAPRPETYLPEPWVDFAWQWTGLPPAQNQAFEVRLWQEGDPYPFGAHDAAAQRNQVRQVGDLYALRLDANGAHALQMHGAGEYLWSVALVEVEPVYRELGLMAQPQRIHIVR